MKKPLAGLTSLLVLISAARAQTTYQRYDCLTRGVEYHIAKSQIESNRQMIEMLENEKKKHSVLNAQGSITRSRIQGVIGAKQEENFRLGQKAFLLMDANQVEDPARYNAALQQLRPKLVPNR
jgi:NADH:ubiquinone oxidoreductase subunit D